MNRKYPPEKNYYCEVGIPGYMRQWKKKFYVLSVQKVGQNLQIFSGCNIKDYYETSYVFKKLSALSNI